VTAAASRWRRDLGSVVVPLGVGQALSVGGWVLATVATRHLLGSRMRPPQYHGVLGWVSWDGGFYRLITEQGYAATSPESIRFFPLYPMLAKVVRVPLGGNTDLALLVIAKVAVVFAAVGIYRLVTLEGGSAALARRSIWCWALFPGAFVLAWAYSEALLVALAAWCIWALRSKRWLLAALLALLAGLCRPIGVALVAAAAVEVLRDRQAVPWRDGFARGIAVLAAPVGAALFCAYSAARGFGIWAPLSSQDELRHTETPFQRIWSLPGELVGHDAFTTGLHVPFVLGFLVLLVIAFRRLPAAYGAFATAVLVAALSAQNLNSVERYAMSAFPLAMALAVVVGSDERLEATTYSVGGALTIGLCALALCGAFVP
jgi:hypothetical protein